MLVHNQVHHGEKIVVWDVGTFESGIETVMEDDEFEESSDYLHDVLGDIGAKFHAQYEIDAVGEDEVLIVDLHCRVDKDMSFMKLWDDAEKELYSGCSKYSKLSFPMRLMHVKIKDN